MESSESESESSTCETGTILDRAFLGLFPQFYVYIFLVGCLSTFYPTDLPPKVGTSTWTPETVESSKSSAIIVRVRGNFLSLVVVEFCRSAVDDFRSVLSS